VAALVARETGSGLLLRWWEGEGNDLRLKAATCVGAVAEGLIVALTTSAEAERGAPREVKRLAGGIDDFEVAFDAQ